MAKKFLTGLTLVNLDSDPLVGSEGELYFNTSASVAKIYKSGAWEELGVGSGGGVTISETAPSTPNVGDLWYQSSTGSLSVWDGSYWVEIVATVGITEEQVQDYASSLFVHNNHENITVTYDDENNEIILSASAGGGTGAGIIVSTTEPSSPEVGTGWYNNETGVLAVWDGTYWVEVNGVIENDPVTQEQIQDYVAPLLDHANHVNISASYDDANNRIVLSASASSTGTGTGVTISETAPEDPQEGDGWYNPSNGSFYLYDGSYWVEVNGIVTITEDQVQDYVSPLFEHNNHTNVVATYDDANGQIILNTSASITNIDSIVYPDYITFDTTPDTEPSAQGSLWWNSDHETLNVQLDEHVTLQVGQEHVVRVKNSSSDTAIPEMSVVMFAGATGDTVEATPAISTYFFEPELLIGITTEEIPADGFGFVTQFGFVNQVDTSEWQLGDMLYSNPASAGYLTNVKPSAPNWTFPIAAVTRVHGSSGRILVRAIPGLHIHDLVDVDIDGNLVDNSILTYNTSSSVWVNSNISDIIEESIHPFLLMGG